MHPVLKVCFSSIKRKKTQKILIAITILLASLVFSLGVAILTMIDKPFENMYKELKASHTLLFYDTAYNNDKDIAGYWNSKEGVESTILAPAYFMQGNAYHDDKKIDISFFIAEVTEGNKRQDILKVIQGEKKSSPDKNEVWIPTTFANENKVKLGDVIELPTLEGSKDYKVAAIVIDPQYSAPQHNPVRVWVKTGELARMFTNNSTGYVIGIRYDEYTEKGEIKIWNDFEKYLGQSFTGYKLAYEDIVSKYTSVEESIGAILLVLSLIIIIVCFIMIYFAISNSILSEYSTIGILKAQGFSSLNIIFSYIFQYMILGIVTIPIGTLLCIPLVDVLTESLTNALGMTKGTTSLWESILLTFVVLMLFIFVVALFASLKTTKIKPSQAIRYGAPASKNAKKSGISLTALKILPVSLMIGIKDTFSNKRQTLFLLITLCITSIILVFTFISIATMENAFEDPNYMGMDDSDLTIVNSYRTNMTDDEIYKKLLKEDKIECVIPMNYLMNSSIYIQKDDISKNIVGNAYNGDMALLGINNSEGRNPSSSNEISISYKLAQRLEKGLGDKLKANIEGEDKELTISGIFSTMSSGGYVFRIKLSSINQSQIAMQTNYQVKTREGVNVEDYEKELSNKFKDAINITNGEKYRETFLFSIKSAISLVTVLISLVVVLVCFITVFNSIVIDIMNMKKNYGIYKSFGMTSFGIRKSLIYKVLFATIIGCIVGIALAIILTPVLIGPALSDGGAVDLTIIVKWSQIIFIVPLCIVVTTISTWIASGRIMKINPRNLVSE